MFLSKHGITMELKWNLKWWKKGYSEKITPMWVLRIPCFTKFFIHVGMTNLALMARNLIMILAKRIVNVIEI